MGIKASGHSALIIAAGLWLGLAGPVRATDSAAEPAGLAAHTENAGPPVKLGKFSKHRSHKHHHAARTRKPARPESKADAKAPEKTASEAQDSDKSRIPLPPTVANANARIPEPAEDSLQTEAGALASSAGDMLPANNQETSAPQGDTSTPSAASADVVPSDELNDVDRAMIDSEQTAPTLALASIESPAPPSTDAPAVQASASTSTWNQASLIGKIFIAFGGLLTLGSAVRMFMA
ncbi:MAG: hypothetical protein NTAFB05_06740 [Nitrobacter sp.]|uniref:hypothetical protein n=1 Tax=Nitrobacter sp. TaxID=29420 RepID=UPI00387DDEA0